MRRLLLFLFVVGVALPGEALGQTAAPPVEAGIEGSLLVTSRATFSGGPRIVVNFDGRNALTVSVSLQALTEDGNLAFSETDLYLAAYKRVLHATERVRIFSTVGGGLERSTFFVPEITFGEQPVTFPSSIGHEVRPAVVGGGGADFRVGRRLAIVVEPAVVVTERFNARFSAGLLVPLRPYPHVEPRSSTPLPWNDLHVGGRAWVTANDGRNISGEVVRRSLSSIDIRTAAGIESLSIQNVAAIDTTDSVRNGAVLGAKIGGIGTAPLSAIVTLLSCALEVECSAGEIVGINAALIGIGTGLGTVTGALIDSLHERRVPVYRRAGAAIAVTPIVRRAAIGAGTVLSW